MPKRKMSWLCAVIVFACAGGLTAVGAVFKHEPNFYRQAHVPACENRKDTAFRFLSSFLQMLKDIETRQETWGFDTTDAQMNCFFAEAFKERGEAEALRRLGISSPSVTLTNDRMRLAFRYGSGWFSTVVSYDLEIWLVPKEPNMIAVKFLAARAGALPISSQSTLQHLIEFAKSQNYEVTLYRHEGNTVATIRLQDEPNPKAILTVLKVGPNSEGTPRLSIRGRTMEHALPPPAIKVASPAVSAPN